MKETELLNYACMKFQDEKYDEALEAFALAYSKGYEQEWIIKNIYDCYMAGNEAVFRETYEHRKVGTKIAYEDCSLDFIPYRDGEYYIFDKEIAKFRGLFSISDLKEANMSPMLQKMEFSAAALVMGWNWNEVLPVLTAAKERNIYVICRDPKRGSSFCKIPELQEYMDNVIFFSDEEQFQEYFHRNTSEYLPHIVFGREEEQKILLKILEQEHNYRLTPEGRNMENVLLTIAVPTRNRGNLLIERMKNLCSIPYDAEIEFVVSKNGTALYQKEYETVANMPDARISYYDHGRDLKAVENWRYSVEMSHGKYVLLVSDEDDVACDAVEHYLKLLHDNPELSLVRGKSRKFYSCITEKQHGKKGLEAFELAFLRQNYLSGLIMKKEEFVQENFHELECFSDNVFYQYYPHEWWCAKLCMKGDYQEEPVLLIEEKESVLKEEAEKYQQMGVLKAGEWVEETSGLPVYATYEERMKQFRAQIAFLHWMMDGNQEGCTIGLTLIIGKIAFLMELARQHNYKPEEFGNVVEEYLLFCMEAVEQFPVEGEIKVRLLSFIRDMGVSMLELHDKMSAGKMKQETM